MQNKDYMIVIYLQFVIIAALILAVIMPEIECSFDWPDIGKVMD